MSPDGRCCSASVRSSHGIAISNAAKASTNRHLASAGRTASARRARSNSGTAAIEVRPNTTTGGDRCSTATLMKRYGTPQIAPISPNSTHPRWVMGRDPCRTDAVEVLTEGNLRDDWSAGKVQFDGCSVDRFGSRCDAAT